MTTSVRGATTEPPGRHGPLDGLRVLVPRATDGPDPLVIALTANGAEPVTVPLIQTVPPEDPTELDDVLLALGIGYYGWLAVTSGAAVPVLADRAVEIGTTLASLVEDVQVAAVGPATERVLRDAGVRVDLVPRGASSATHLLAEWPPLPAAPGLPDDGSAASRVLVPRGDLAAPTLAVGLRARGWTVDEIVAYRTVPGPAPDDATRADWSEGRIGAVVLTSGSSARNLVELLGPPPPGTLVVCLGPSTAAVAERIGLDVAAVATEQTPTGLVAALVAALAAPPPTTTEVTP
ncbi:MAG TPA: uroporphyrinogen-III synthase [Cellulomonas sp.]|uniref:uroporphyrinogen-III synthase n=1 Tax=Cellulomonas sp. TaxID=40001 RepID=UPI002E3120CA|nr:uroporphyrinogen-III synthase [Cellulomonas sp.]HEX5333721.1 uroporphyrinogen-III synthase [Cellulomonas sp.]